MLHPLLKGARRLFRGELRSSFVFWFALSLPATVNCATSAAPAAPAAKADEAHVMARLRQEEKGAPGAALARADEADVTFGESSYAEERRALAIQALVDLGRLGEARSRAYKFIERYPTGSFSAYVQELTGIHPTPSMGPAH